MSRGCNATLTIHRATGHSTDAEGRWTMTFEDEVVAGTAATLKRSEENQIANQNWERGRVVFILPSCVSIDLDAEITASGTVPNGNLDGRYKVTDVRHLRVHSRVFADRLEAE